MLKKNVTVSFCLIISLSFCAIENNFAEEQQSYNIPKKSTINQIENSTTSPKETIETALKKINQDLNLQQPNTPQEYRTIVEKNLIPYIDFVKMTQLATGKIWKEADEEQKVILAQEFQEMLLRVYTRAFMQFKNQNITIEPSKTAPSNSEYVRVNTTIKNKKENKSIEVLYTFKHIKSAWKVIDLEVEGVSLIIAYRTKFYNAYDENGVDGVINMLEDKNNQAKAKEI